MGHRLSNVIALVAALGSFAGTQSPVLAEAASSSTSETLQTIVITAEKRRESTLDVPMSVTALSGSRLVNEQAFRFNDYAATVPGLTFLDSGGGGGELVIRGLTTGIADINTGVAVYLDDTPLTPNSSWASPEFDAQDLDTYDMQRVEVLKGPQGTLYGANAIGGLIKYVTNPPDPSKFAASAEAGMDSIYNGKLGYDYHGMLNVPIADNFAIRMVGYNNFYPGYIDDPSRGAKDVNDDRYDGGRVSLLYEATPDLSLQLTALYQSRKAADFGNGAEDVNPITLTPLYGRLTQERLISQPSTSDTQVYNGTLKWNLGPAQLLSSTSYSKFSLNLLSDLTTEYGIFTPEILGAPYGVAYPNDFSFHTITQELRLTSQGAGPLQWQVGGYFTNQDSYNVGALLPIDTATAAILSTPLLNITTFAQPATYREFSEYADLDWHITPTLDLGLGGRYSRNKQAFTQLVGGLLTPPINLHETSSQGVFTYSGDVRWHVTHQNMLYARLSEGYVPGGPNNTFPGSPLPTSFKSSTTVNYEAGAKSRLLDGRLTAQLAAYDIEWRDIQLGVTIGGITGNDNAGKARSKGVEWEIGYVPISGLTLDISGSYTDAHLTNVIPAVVTTLNANSGDRLPFVPHWQSSANARYEWLLGGDYTGFAGLSWRLTGARKGNFEAVGPMIGSSTQENIPGFRIWDLRMGVRTGRWTATVYAKNIGNTLGINFVSDETLFGTEGPQSAVLYPPRTIGFSVAASL